MSGDPLQQFSIHPRSGEITVRTALDREEVSVSLNTRKKNLNKKRQRVKQKTKKKKKAEFHLSPLQIPHYSLTVQAADEGDPPLSSAVLITVTVTDVNDNPPVFSQVNHSLLLQV